MFPIRALFSTNSRSLGDRVDELRRRADAVRNEPGCLEFDFFRGIEFPENFVLLELWENAEAFDRHWASFSATALPTSLRELCAPFHGGTADFPRRHGRSGAEFYPKRDFTFSGRTFVAADPTDRLECLRLPTVGGVRIVISSSTDPASDESFYAYSAETRAQAGCLEFDFFRSLEFPENNLHLELWAGPPAVYDDHYALRTLQVLYGQGLARPPSSPVERRYGTAGFEFYQHQFYTHADGVWEPEDPAARLFTVRW